MKRFLTVILISLLPSMLYALAAFPGAEGMGASSLGGRYGTPTIYKVTNLNNSGTGSFRAACEASGARIVVFAVSGVIQLTSDLAITNSYITIAGQTSPRGVVVAHRKVQFGTAEQGLHDAVIMHMRFRCGPLSYGRASDGYATVEVNGGSSIGGQYGSGSAGTDPTHNIIFDHCSFSWASDTNINVNLDVYDLTFSWCSIVDPLANAGYYEDPNSEGHNLGILFWGLYNSTPYGCTMHHCYFGDCYYRIPDTNNAAFTDLTNNVAYHFIYQYAPMLQPDTSTSLRTYMNIVGCYQDVRHSDTTDEARSCILMPDSVTPYQAIYMSGNVTSYYPSPAAWNAGDYNNSYGLGLLSTNWQKSSPFTVRDIPVTATTMNSTYAAYVVAHSGANRVQATTDLTYDSIDLAAQTRFTNNTGAWKDATTITSVSSWGTYSTSDDNPTDSDSDGMTDSIEITLWGSTSNTATGDADSDGYLNIEEYIFYLGGYQDAETPTATRTLVNGAIRNGTFHP